MHMESLAPCLVVATQTAGAYTSVCVCVYVCASKHIFQEYLQPFLVGGLKEVENALV